MNYKADKTDQAAMAEIYSGGKPHVSELSDREQFKKEYIAARIAAAMADYFYGLRRLEDPNFDGHREFVIGWMEKAKKYIFNLQDGILTAVDRSICEFGVDDPRTQALLYDGDPRTNKAEGERRSEESRKSAAKSGFPTYYPYGGSTKDWMYK